MKNLTRITLIKLEISDNKLLLYYRKLNNHKFIRTYDYNDKQTLKTLKWWFYINYPETKKAKGIDELNKIINGKSAYITKKCA